MSLVKSMIFFVLFIFSLSPAFAFGQDTDCCAQLRQEVQMIKDQLKNQQMSVAKELSQQQTTTKTGFKGIGSLIEFLSTQFPNQKALGAVKQIFDTLNK